MTAKQTNTLRDMLLGVVVGTVAGLGAFFFTSSVSPELQRQIEMIQQQINAITNHNASYDAKIDFIYDFIKAERDSKSAK